MTRDPWFRNRLIRDAIYRAIEERMRIDPSVYLLGEGAEMKIHFDAPSIERDFPGRVITMPISEDSNTNFAVGLSLGGCLPVVDVITADFLFRTMDSICNTAAKQATVSKPRTIIVRAEFMTGGPTTGQRLEALFTHVPGLNVVIPSNPLDAYALMRDALSRPEVTLFFEDREIEDATSFCWSSVDDILPFGKASLWWPGGDVTVVTYGLMARRLQLLRSRAHELGLSYELIDLRTIYPIDWETIFGSVSRTRALLVVEPDVKFGGIGAEIVARVSDGTSEDGRVPYGRPTEPGIATHRLGAPRITIPIDFDQRRRLVPSDDDILNAIAALS